MTQKGKDEIQTWLGGKIKNMSTDAEKSAAGIDDIKGIILIDVPTESTLYKMGGRVGDVILKVNGIEVNTIEDLFQKIRKLKRTHNDSVTLWVEGNPPAHEIVLDL